MKKRVLLINPPYSFAEIPSPPFGLMSLAAYLLEKGHDVIIEDYVMTEYSKKRVKKIIIEFKPDVIGATGVTMNIKKSLSILKDCKDISRDACTVLGGPHATFDVHNIMKENSHVDFIVRGEGELTFTELLETIGKPDSYTIEGISYRSGSEVIDNPTRPFIEDINILPMPARHLIELSKYKAAGLAINMVTSRGCPFTCIFCVGRKMSGKKMRYFDVNRVVDEFEILAGYGFRQINIADDLFTSHRKRCLAVCDEIIRRGIDHPWSAFARVDTVTPDLLKKMKEAGCINLCFGIESGNQEILDTVQKKTNLAMCKKAIAMCDDAGIIPLASYILGLPGETEDTVKTTMQFARELGAQYGYHILAPFPGTEVRDQCEAYGINILTSDWDLYDANRSVCESVHIPGKEIESIVKNFYEGIEKYMTSISKKREEKIEITSTENELASNRMSTVFAITLIKAQLIEKFPAVPGSREHMLLDDFAAYIAEKTGFNKETISMEIDRLIKTHCIEIVHNNDMSAISWADITKKYPGKNKVLCNA